MKNGLIIFILAFTLGLSLSVGYHSVLAQFFIKEEEITKIDIINPTEADKRFGTSTFSSIQEAEITKETWRNNQEVLRELKEINKNLKEIKYVWQKR